MCRHHECSVRSDDLSQCLDDGLRATRDPPESRERRMHDDGRALVQAEGTQIRGE
jgi:hypothetical protein